MINGKDVLLTERKGHVYVLTINREERMNALSPELLRRYDEEMEIFNEDDDLWVLVLTGAGGRAFCAGMDLKEFSQGASAHGSTGRPPARRREHPAVHTWKPTIAAINGFALAGGWQLAQRCDLRVAADSARIGITENKWNLAGGFGAEMGVFPTAAISAEVYLLAEPITAQRAYEIGFVNKVVRPEEVLSQAMSWAEHICTLGQEAVRGHKQLAYYGRFVPPSELAQLSKDIFYWMGQGKPGVVVDSTVGSRAFVENRKPDYSAMFHPRRLSCTVCGSVYVVAADHAECGAVTCCGREMSTAAG